MISRLKKFCIFGLWGEKQVELSFAGDKLLLVGENGSGKTTILRMIYETLACKWAMLSLEEFDYIELHFENADTVKIEKEKVKDSKGTICCTRFNAHERTTLSNKALFN